MVAAATGTPSWAVASMAYGAGWRRGTATRCARAAPTPEAEPQHDHRRVVDQVAQLEPGTQPDEEERAEEALGDREQLLGDPPRLADRGHREAGAKPASIRETCIATARAAIANSAVRLTRSSTANCRSSETACTRSRTPLRSTDRSGQEEDAAGDQHDRGAERGAGDVVRGRSPAGAGRCRPRRRPRPAAGARPRGGPSSPRESTIGSTSAAEDDAISTAYKRGVGDADEPRDGVPEDAGRDADHGRADQPGAQGGAQPRVADRDVGAGHEHHQHEAGIAEEGEGRVARVEHPEAGDAEHDARQQLAEDDRQVPAPRGGEQRVRPGRPRRRSPGRGTTRPDARPGLVEPSSRSP